MRKTISADPLKTYPAYQPCKLYVKFPAEVLYIVGFESKLEFYFSRFGPILDIKILENSALISAPKGLLFRFFSGRGIFGGGSKQGSLFRGLQSEVKSSFSPGQSINLTRIGGHKALQPTTYSLAGFLTKRLVRSL